MINNSNNTNIKNDNDNKNNGNSDNVRTTKLVTILTAKPTPLF